MEQAHYLSWQLQKTPEHITYLKSGGTKKPLKAVAFKTVWEAIHAFC
jgi:hypothetical protein